VKGSLRIVKNLGGQPPHTLSQFGRWACLALMVVVIAFGLGLAGNGRVPARAAAPTATGLPPPGAGQASDALVSSAPVTATVVDVIVPSGEAVATATTDLNVRSGPGVAYPLVGYLPAGQSAPVTGVNAGGDWLQIVHPPAPPGAGGQAGNGRGWVARRYVTTGDLSNVPVVAAPPLPALATPAATPTNPAGQEPIPTTPPAPITDWQGEYFDNPALTGAPRVVRNDVDVDFNWSGQPPLPGFSVDNWSARWTRTANFHEGNYRFTLLVDDGARLWVDGNLIVDQWHDSEPTTYRTDWWLGAGPHQVRLEYYQHFGSALVTLAWHRPDEDWKAQYFNNRKLDGDPVLERYESGLNDDWGQGSPGPGVAADNFSARWTRKAHFDEGTYTFTVDADDGVRLWVEGKIVIDDWQDGNRTRRHDHYFDDDGDHNVRVEYYEHWGGAHIRVSWAKK
jgi:hypothetical protein